MFSKAWWQQRLHRSRHMANRSLVALLVYAFAVGVGLLAVGFALLSDHAAHWNQDLYRQYPMLALALPPLCFPLILWVVRRWFWGAEGGGIPQAIKAIRNPQIHVVERLLGWRALLGKIIFTPLVLATGATLGREGPTVQLGAALMLFAHRIPLVARFFDQRALIVAGGAAGIAAAFNTPLGGLMFAFEELGRGKLTRHTSALLLAIVLAGLVTLIVQGNYAYFGYSKATIDWIDGWYIMVAVGLLTGLIGSLYGLLMLALVSKHNALGRWRSRHPYWFACLCGLALSLLAWTFGGQVLGAGYEETKLALQDSEELSPSFWLSKFLASLVCFASGLPGGVFAPTLSIGAGLGHFVSNLAGLDESAIMLLAMAGLLAATTHCPITAFVIVVEMVDNHDMMMPLIFVSALASVVSKRLLPESIYHILATQMRLPAAPNLQPHLQATAQATAQATEQPPSPSGTQPCSKA